MIISLRKGDDSLMSSGIVTLISRVMAGPLRYTPRAEVKVLEEASPVIPRGSLWILSAAYEGQGWARKGRHTERTDMRNAT